MSKEAKQIADGHDLEVLSKFRQSSGDMWKLADDSKGVVLDPLVRPVIRFRGEIRDILKQIEQYGELCFEEQRPQKQAMRTAEQGASVARKREGAEDVDLARQPLQRRTEEDFVVEAPPLDYQSTKPPIVRNPYQIEEVDHGVELLPSSSHSRRYQQQHPSAPPIRSDDESRQISGLRMRSREPTQMSLLRTVPSPPTPHAAKVAPSHPPPEGLSWKERVSYVKRLTPSSDDSPEADCPVQSSHPSDSHHGHYRVGAHVPAALPPEVGSAGGRVPKELCALARDESSRGVGVAVEDGDTAAPPKELAHDEDIWSAAMRTP